MRRTPLLLVFILIALTSCSNQKIINQKQEIDFSKENIEKIKSKAKIYSNKELQNGEVPLYEYIQLSGEIVVSDSKDEGIKKGDRFILQQDDYQYQIINEQEQVLSIGDKVIVYGEYYGFVKGTLIERSKGID